MFSASQGRDSRRNRSMKDFIINLDPWGRARSWLYGARALLCCKIFLNICPVAGDGLCAHVHLAGLSLCSISKPLVSPASPQEAAHTASAGRSLPLAWHRTCGRGFLCKGGHAAAPPVLCKALLAGWARLGTALPRVMPGHCNARASSRGRNASTSSCGLLTTAIKWPGTQSARAPVHSCIPVAGGHFP